MKIMIASDVHGSAYYAAKIKEVFAKEGACLLVLLGDIYNPGPRNPIAAVRDYAPLKVAEVFNSLKDRLMVIKGNCDSQVDTLISEFHFAEEGQLFVAGKRITLTHGHVLNRDELPPACGDALIYGHVHTGFIERKGGVTIANPGSVTLPKEGSAHGYLVLEEDVLTLKDINDGKIIRQEKIRGREEKDNVQ